MSPKTVVTLKSAERWCNTPTKLAVIDRLYDALPPEFKVEGDYVDKATAVAVFNDTSRNDRQIIEWYERALVGVRTRKENPVGTNNC